MTQLAREENGILKEEHRGLIKSGCGICFQSKIGQEEEGVIGVLRFL